MYKAIIVALGMALFTIGHLSAQAPQSCEPEDRVRSNDLTTPCKIPIPEPESVTLEYTPYLGDPYAPQAESVCRVRAVLDFGQPVQWPSSFDSIGIYTGRQRGTSGWSLFTTSTAAISIGYKTITGAESWGRSAFYQTEPFLTVTFLYTLMHAGKEHGVRQVVGPISMPMPETVNIGADLDQCVAKLALDYEHQQTITALKAQEAETGRAEELKELTSLNAIKIAEEVGRIEARIDALRLEVAKRIDANVIKLNLVLEANIQAGIEMDRQITELLIETRKKELAALEARADLVRSWVIDKQDKWDELASLQSDYQTRIDDLQDETAASLAELERTKATVSAAIVASEARARELNEQLRTSQADEAALNAQLAAAEAELAEARKRLQALESGDATPTPAP